MNSTSSESDSNSGLLDRRGQFARLARLCAKELREILRDRRTIVTLVLMPLLVYPILSLTFNRFLLNSISDQDVTEVELVVGFKTVEEYQMLVGWHEFWSRELANPILLHEPEENEPIVRFVESATLDQDLRKGQIDLALGIAQTSRDGAPRGNLPPQIDAELQYGANSHRGKLALAYIARRLEAINTDFDAIKLRTSLPIRSTETTVALDSDRETASPFASFIPLVLILMTITGAVYPAIDLTAGERERGTMEALIAAPIPRVGLLLAKYVAVLMVAVLTATANLLAMAITLSVSPLGAILFGDGAISWGAMLQIYSLMILFASFFSAILLAMTSFARSFKEAQAYLIPIMLVSLGPGVLSLIPSIELTPLFAVLPLLNLVLLARDTIQSQVDPLLATIAVSSTFCYAMAAITLAGKIFGTDAILYGSQASWSDLFRAPRHRPANSSISGAMLTLAALFPLQFIAASEVAKWSVIAQTQSVPLSIEAPEDMAESTQLVVTDVPEDFAVEGGSQNESGNWLVPDFDGSQLVLLSDIVNESPFSIGLVWTDADGNPLGLPERVEIGQLDLQTGIQVVSRGLGFQLLLNALVTLALFVVVPFLAATWQRAHVVSTFRLHAPHPVSFLPAVLLGVALWPAAHEIVVMGIQVGVGTLSGKAESIAELTDNLRQLSPLVVLAAMALTPAVCEEFFFRGFLLQALRTKLTARQAIIASALLFGAFHLIGSQVLAPERFLPSSFLGLFLGWVAIRTGSVLPGMLLHFMHNGVLMMIAYYQPWLEERGWMVDESNHLPVTWLASSVVVVSIGVGILFFLGRSSRPPVPTVETSDKEDQSN